MRVSLKSTALLLAGLVSADFDSDLKLAQQCQFNLSAEPMPIHSHNDYTRATPLFEALSYGCLSVEADVWWVNNELEVGHVPTDLVKGKTLDYLYIQPLVDLLKCQNKVRDGLNGIYSQNATKPLQLLIDVKTDGPSTWPHVVEALEPLRERGWLTFLENGTIHERAITVVGTGNTPLDQIEDLDKRDYFFDGPLANVGNLSASVAPLASTNFFEDIGIVWQPWTPFLVSSQIKKVQSQVDAAHEKGIKARYWNTPQWPSGLRDGVMSTLWEQGHVDFLNADDLAAAVAVIKGESPRFIFYAPGTNGF
ncbi:Altered inheritance of mitochondria protein 6-like protein [Yarrowia sp. B02]|nr:Altered inheritance of mitochondria protein 6-like protein [Yarrowia sp. B02]